MNNAHNKSATDVWTLRYNGEFQLKLIGHHYIIDKCLDIQHTFVTVIASSAWSCPPIVIGYGLATLEWALLDWNGLTAWEWVLWYSLQYWNDSWVLEWS